MSQTSQVHVSDIDVKQEKAKSKGSVPGSGGPEGESGGSGGSDDSGGSGGST